jgi:hypothetical protein
VSIQLARRYFKLPRSVLCHVGDGLDFMQKTRHRFDVLILDAFIGERIPAHMKDDRFFKTASRCVKPNGVVLVNVCLAPRSDLTADRIAAGFAVRGSPVRILDSPGPERNAIVMAGKVKKLGSPRMLMPPQADAKKAGEELVAMRFRRRRPISRKR